MNEYDCCDGCGESSPYCTNCHTCGDCVNEALESQTARISTLEAQLKDRNDTIMRLERFTKKQGRQLEACAGKLKEHRNG